MAVLVTGSTGFLGSKLVQKLGRVKTFSEEDGDIRDIVALERSFPADVVYHLAASLDESNPAMYEINVEGTENVLRLCRKYKAKQLVFMSSSGVLGETLIPAAETFDYNPKTAYERSKTECEKIIRASNVSYTIIRAPVILGPNKIWQSIFRQARRSYPIIGSGKNKFHLAYIDDVVDLLVHVKNNRTALNEIFHVATQDIPTYEEVYSMICRELRAPLPQQRVSVNTAKTYAALHTLSSVVKGRKPDVTKMGTSIDRLVRNRMLSINKAKVVLGFRPKYTTKRAVSATAAELKSRKMI